MIFVRLSFCRSYGRHSAHLSLSVFRLYGLKDSYDALTALLQKTSDAPVPAFDCRGGARGGGERHVCELGACKALSKSLLALPLPDAGDDVVRSGTGGGAASSSGTNGGRKVNRKRPESVSSPRAGATKRQRQQAAPASVRSRSAPPAEGLRAGEHAGAAMGGSSVAAEAAAMNEAAAAASAWKLGGSRTTAAPSDVTASPSISSSPGAGYFSSSASACGGTSSPSTAAVAAAAAAAVASATATAVAVATSSAATIPRSSDVHELPGSAPSFGVVKRSGSACGVPIVSEDSANLWPSTVWEDGKGGGVSQGFGGGFAGTSSNKNNMNDQSDGAQSNQQDCYLPPLGSLHAQSGSNIAGIRRGDRSGGGGGGGGCGGGGTGFVSDSSHYAATEGRHEGAPLITLATPGIENCHHSQQRRVEGGTTGHSDYEEGIDGPGSWPVQGSDVSAATTTAAAERTMAWTDPNAREVMPAWFGGANGTEGVGPITLPPPDRGSSRDWSGGGGEWRHHNISVAAAAAAAAAAAVAHQWPQRQPGTDSGLLAGRPGKLMGAGRHVRVPSFRAGSDPNAHHVRRPSGRAFNGSEFDFVYELGMLLNEEEYSADVRKAVSQHGR